VSPFEQQFIDYNTEHTLHSNKTNVDIDILISINNSFRLLQIEALEKTNDVNNVVTRSIDCDQTDGVTHNLFPGL